MEGSWLRADAGEYIVKTEKKDPMAIVMLLGGLVIILIAVGFLVSSLINTINRNTTRGADSEDNVKFQQAMVAERLKPIGILKAGYVPKVPPPRSGKQIVADVCGECHGDGSMGAPMIGTSDWAKRYKRGFAALLKTAQNGKGDMPARGDEPSLTDYDLKKAIAYMLKKSGLTPPNIEPIKKKGEGKDAAGATTAGAGAEPSAAAEGGAKPVAPADEGGAAAPAPTEPEPATDQTTSAAGALGTGSGWPESEYSSFELEAVPPAERGRVVYQDVCADCHQFMSPRTGVKAEWQQVAVKGMDALYRSTLLGTFSMPPKGGRLDLSDEAIKSSVDYMAFLAR